jgi:hypothetical protein
MQREEYNAKLREAAEVLQQAPGTSAGDALREGLGKAEAAA